MRIIMISTAYHGYVHAFAYPIETLADTDNRTAAIAYSEALPEPKTKIGFRTWMANLIARRSEARI